MMMRLMGLAGLLLLLGTVVVRGAETAKRATVVLVEGEEAGAAPGKLGGRYDAHRRRVKLVWGKGREELSGDEGEDGDWVATAAFVQPEDRVSFFGQLDIKTNEAVADDTLQSYAAGYLEGALTGEYIYNAYLNFRCQVDCDGQPTEGVKQWLDEQDAWMRSTIAAHEGEGDPYYDFLATIQAQFDGLVDGYAATFPEYFAEAGVWELQLLNDAGDLFDIQPAVDMSKRMDYESMTVEEVRLDLLKRGHCSAFIKVTDTLEDAFISHSTWMTYSGMLRIFKVYDFALNNPDAVTRQMIFSSYPGVLASLDDFYVNMQGEGKGTAMVQTTNGLYTQDLYDLVTPNATLSWQRVRLANTLSASGPAWYQNLRRHNSGTYTNQYTVLDMNLFQPGQALVKNTLYVVEQIPGLTVGGDTTSELERSYWPSFNVPYWPEIYRISGYGEIDARAGNTFGTEYQLAPRANIFRRDSGGVVGLDSLKRLMRANNYQEDPLSDGSAWNAICSRGDLATPPGASGCYDTKATSVSLAFSADGPQIDIINGPTTENQVPFSWTDSGLGDTADHYGQPDVFDFEFETVMPRTDL